jgi:chemotaxis response regulator CheB
VVGGKGGHRYSETMTLLPVLIADDYETVRRGICAILESRGDIEGCAQAANGEEAVRKAKELIPDVIIMHSPCR